MKFLFDLGGVFFDWNPRYFYNSIFDTTKEMEFFLENICNDDWNKKHDEGQPFEEGITKLSKIYPQYANLIQDWFGRWEEMLGDPLEETVKILAELKNLGIPLYILSNWSAETFPKAEAIFDFLNWFDGKIISGEVGIIKPNPEIFYALTKKFNLNPENSVFIDDKLINIKAAKLIGFHGIHFKNPELLRNDLKKMSLI